MHTLPTRARSRGNGQGTITYDPKRMHEGVRGWYVGMLPRKVDPVTGKQRSAGPLIFASVPGRNTSALRSVQRQMEPYLNLASGGGQTLNDFAAQWNKTAPRARTRGFYECNVQYFGFLGKMALVKIQRPDVARLLALLAEEYNPPTVSAVYRTLRRLFGIAFELRIITEIPMSAKTMKPVVPKREYLILNPKQVVCLMQAVYGDVLYEAYVLLALACTLGPAELDALRWTEVFFDAPRPYVFVKANMIASKESNHRPRREALKRKGRMRKVGINPALMRALLTLKAHADKQGGRAKTYLFNSPEGGPLHQSNHNKRWWRPLVLRAAELAAENGLDFPVDLRFYDLRHTANALMSWKRIPLQVASRRMGHGNVRTTTECYPEMFTEVFEEAEDVIDGLFVDLEAERAALKPAPLALPA